MVTDIRQKHTYETCESRLNGFLCHRCSDIERHRIKYNHDPKRKPKFIDRTKKTYHRLTVIRESHKKNGVTFWVCDCICGKRTTVSGWALGSGNTKSCGCLKTNKDL